MSDGTEKIELKVLGLSSSNVQSGAFALILAETQGDRRIPIVIGRTEAQSIAIILDNVEIPRPLTHDLFYNFAHDFDITLKEVVIYKLEEGIFYSVLIFHKQGDSGLVKIDSRTSDAVALALRFNVPIYTYEYIIKKTGIVIEVKSQSNVEDKDENALTSKSIEELKGMLDKAIITEDYEKASEIRDEIKRRS